MLQQLNKIINMGYENMSLHSYKEGFEGMPHTVWYDELVDNDVSGVLKANYYEDGKLKQVYSEKDNHCVVVAGTGLGKTTQFVVPTIYSYANQKTKKSLVISDPKGEVRALCEGILRKNGYNVLRLDFREPSRSECWNPLTQIYRKYHSAFSVKSMVKLVKTPDGPRNKFMGRIYTNQLKLDKDISRFSRMILEEVGNDIDNIATIIAPSTGSVNDKLWEDGARDCIRAFLWAMLEDSREETKNCQQLITEDTYSFATMIAIANTFTGEWDSSGPEYDNGYFSNRIKRNKDSKGFYYAANTIVGPARSTRASYLSVFNTQISVFKETAVRLITSCNSFDFSELMEGPVAIFINYKDEVKSNYMLISLFVQSLYIYLIDRANKMSDGKLSVPWYFILDEFGNFPQMRDFETVISACRGRNIFFSLVIQSYSQLQGVYGYNTAEIIKDNLNVHIFIGSNNYETLNAFSNECGKITRISPLSALNGNKEKISNYQIETIPLMPISTLSKFNEGECIVTEANTGFVMWSRLERYYKCKEFEPIKIEYDEYVSGVDPFDDKYIYNYKPLVR